MEEVFDINEDRKVKSKNLAVLAEQTSLIYASAIKGLFATVINALILVVVLWPVISHNILLIWLVSILFISSVRSFFIYQYKTLSPSMNEAHFWMRRFLVGSIAASVIWGASSIWLFPSQDLARQVFLAFVLGGMAAGAITSLSYNKVAIYTFLSFTLIPLLVRFFHSGIDLSFAMGTMMALYFVVLFQSAKEIYIRNNENINMRISNIEQQRSLNESEHRYETLLDTATDAFILHDSHGKIINVNNQACKSLGYTKDELINLSVSDIDVDVKTGKLKEPWNKIKKGENIRIESTHYRKDGTTFPVEVAVGNINMGHKTLFSVLARDITERKRIEKMKNEFVSTVSHELRTPLTSIVGSLGLMKGGALGELTPQGQEILTIAENNTKRLLGLVNDILHIQKIESGELDMVFEKVKVMPFLKQSIDDNYAYAEKFGVKIILNPIEDVLYVNANKNRLMQVMANLLSNAAKFSHENGIVEVSVARRKNNIIRVSVADHGNGIAEKFYTTIFDKFTQEDSSDTRSKGGTGLGLNISKAIIEKHGGKIGFKSKVGEGATFYFDLPEFVEANNTQ